MDYGETKTYSDSVSEYVFLIYLRGYTARGLKVVKVEEKVLDGPCARPMRCLTNPSLAALPTTITDGRTATPNIWVNDNEMALNRVLSTRRTLTI